MGYAVYELGGRWCGYGVPAECDMPGCAAEIDRGFGFRCGESYFDERPDYLEPGEDWCGCGLYFCKEHRYDTDAHTGVTEGKPDSEEWVRHMLSDESWAQWRSNNPARVVAMQEVTGLGGQGEPHTVQRRRGGRDPQVPTRTDRR